MNRIVFDCERMKYADNGIYQYCLNLGKEIQKQLNNDEEQITFYLPQSAHKFFTQQPGQNGRHQIRQTPLHKFSMPDLNGYDIWHATFQHSDYLPELNKKIKVLLTVHDINFMYKHWISESKKEKYLANLQKRINRADVIICISEYCKNDVLRYCDTAAKKIVTIYNGTNTLQPPKLNSDSFIPGKPFLFSIGTIRRQKNFHAMFALLRDNSGLDLVIAGSKDDVEYLNYMKSLATEMKIQENVHVLGQISEQEKSWYFHQCKAFVFPSLAEGFGLPVLEAMSIGKPVFLSDKTALPEIGSDAAFYFDDFTAESMQNIFTGGMKHFEKNGMIHKIKKRADSFSWQKSAAEYIKVYRSLLSN